MTDFITIHLSKVICFYIVYKYKNMPKKYLNFVFLCGGVFGSCCFGCGGVCCGGVGVGDVAER